MMRGKGKTPPFCGGWLRDFAFDSNRAGSTRPASATVECLRRAVVEREPSSYEHHAEIRSLRTFDRLTGETNDRHASRTPADAAWRTGRSAAGPAAEPRPKRPKSNPKRYQTPIGACVAGSAVAPSIESDFKAIPPHLTNGSASGSSRYPRIKSACPTMRPSSGPQAAKRLGG